MRVYDRRDIEQLKGAEKNKEEYISIRRILISICFVLALVIIL